ncbi:YbaB/EbfC family nucleoid-associated protein [Saccharopolyspora sp. K220]|uniref:YbaB/EbfC family nucleoid-associated protein n=1 Tax=Saccharopolyspora soli TaxID=2926618 RepID=UPI001F5A1E0E|nr:YbaB/EbfC family nucleoid-associated protein [Saccharopolyspora soli]MCI2419860.1 YbaB/EbfC family nucleoid-associated protein [Saccharopolyspora soli]
MTNPDSRKAELEARNAAMREQVSSLLEGLHRQTAQLQEAQAAAMAATGEATSADGLATVRVNAVGIVTDVQISPSAFKTSTPEKLARSFLQAAQAAARDARGKADSAMSPVTEQVPDLPDLFPGAPSLKDLMPPPPEPTTPPASSNPPEDDDWDEFDPRSSYRKDQW